MKKQKNRMEPKVEQKMNEKLNNEQNKRTTKINTTRYNWHMSTMNNIITSVFIEIGWNVTVQALHRVKKYPCEYRTNNYNPILPGINSEISHATEGPCAYLKK
jgi:hypothetical protein